MDLENKPLSPHLQVYKPQITSVLSIVHRATGVALAFGAIALACWIISGAYGKETFLLAQTILGHWLGQIFLFGWTLCLFYHLFNGIRHLFWDSGKGLELHHVNLTGWLVLVMTIIFTGLIWLFN